MWRRSYRRLGARVLALGHHGPDVVKLQEKLIAQGYEPGDADGVFGYSTQDALEQFQRDFHLDIDGMAGRNVYSLLLQEHLPMNRRVHVVQPGDTVKDIAAQYQVGAQALRSSVRERPLYVGQQLVFFDRAVWGVLADTVMSRESYRQRHEQLTGVMCPVRLDQQQEKIRWPNASPRMALVELPPQNTLAFVHRLLKSRRRQRACLEFLKEAAGRADGLYLPWISMSRVDGLRYERFVRRLRKLLPETKRLMVALSPTMPQLNVFGGIRFEGMSRTVDGVVVPVDAPTNPAPILNPQALEKTIHQLLHHIPAWKMVLHLPVSAMEWVEQDGEWVSQSISYADALRKVYRGGARIAQDEDGSAYYRFGHKESNHQVRVTARQALDRVMWIINRYNLAGCILDQLGMEDQRLWEGLSRYFGISRRF